MNSKPVAIDQDAFLCGPADLILNEVHFRRAGNVMAASLACGSRDCNGVSLNKIFH